MWVPYVLTILGGLGNGLQPGLNATLRDTLGQPILAGLVSIAGTTTTLVFLGVLTGRLGLPDAGRWGQVP